MDWDDYDWDDEDYEWVSFRDRMRNALQPIYNRFEPQIVTVEQVSLTIQYVKTRAFATAFLKAAMLVHDYYSDFCAKAPQIDDEEELLQYKKRAPVESLMCSEKAQLIANYATFIVTVPGFVSLGAYHKDMKWWGVENYTE